MKYLRLGLLLMFITLSAGLAFGQEQSERSEQTLPQLQLSEDEVEFDAESGNYLFYRRGEEPRKPYKVLTKEQFDNESMDKAMQNNWKKRRDEAATIAGEKDAGFVPRLRTQVEGDAFGKVFGGNDITVNFNGTVELLFSIRSTKIDNPLTPPEFRRVTAPNFETKYQLNVTGNIGTRIKWNFAFDPNATFDFETNLKLGYEGTEDDILQFVELGNITLPLRSTLITGSQSLFGGKVGLRFGKLDMTLVGSQQRGQSKTIEVRGGSQNNKFEIHADKYDINRHFFLSHYFRDNYERALAQYPLIVSGANITRLEVWVTNKTNRTDDVRNVVSFMDLAEPDVIFNKVPSFAANPAVRVASNDANRQYQTLITQYAGIRNFANINGLLEPLAAQRFIAGQDYEKLGRARKLSAAEYTYHPQLGYISLNAALNNDEVLAVAYEYTLNGQMYQVGELSTDGTTGSDSTLILKQLKGTILSPLLPTWHLMMKNIYSINAYNLNSSNFSMDIFYEDDKLGVGVPYIAEGPIAKQPLISVLGVDRLNFQLDPYPDGIFDFVPGVTISPERGRIIFPVLEPFGSTLKKKFKGDPIASKYVFQELYDSTFVMANKQTERNKFRLQGHYEGSNRGEIQLEAMNVPEGSVVVMAGGVRLLEGLDYQVNYMAGVVTIINSSYLESGVPITITLENRELYNMQTKTLVGADLTYNFSKNLRLGGTILHLNERPLTQKVAYNEDPVSNTIWGLNTSYATESQMLTNWVNKLPFLETKEKSMFTFDAEVANLIAGQPKGMRGELFVDDFDGAKTSLDLHNYLAWTLASTPQGQLDMFPEGDKHNDRAFGFKRAKLAWNWIDPELQRNGSSTPAYIRQNPAKFQHDHRVRAVIFSELYPNRELPIGTPDDIQTLNLNFYPRERGPYNYDLNIDNQGFLREPEKRWGGIMRPMTITDFETANYDYIEFWVMDPFIYNKDKNANGDFYINLGTISEDVLRDGQKSYEQGIPFPFDTASVIKTAWGYVPRNPPLINTFDNDETLRSAKDVGLDGMHSNMETAFFADFVNNIRTLITNPEARTKLSNDPSSDDFIYYRASVFDERQADILDRYKDFNNQENNSSQSGQAYTIDPDMEDINRDNTMEEAESYFQYHIKFRPNMRVGEDFINDIRDTVVHPDQPPVRWYQFMVPLSQYNKVVGPIRDFRSIRFMRMFMRGFKDTTVMRFATLELVRNEWRRFEFSLIKGQEGITVPEMPDGGFEVSTVGVEENSNRIPVNYVMPPGTDRVIDPSTIQERQLNEQALQLIVRDLPDGDARAVFKNTKYDFRQYHRLQMDVHAEALPTGANLKNDDLSVFVRIGNDLRDNYYEYEIPLKLTPPGHYTDAQREIVWPRENFMDIDLNEFTDIKLFRNKTVKDQGGSMSEMYERQVGNHTIRVKGNPNMGDVRSVMIGVRNPVNKDAVAELGMPYSGVVWVNEMRLSDFDNRGGWAGTARTGVKLADFGNVSLAGGFMTAGFGGLEQRQSERSQEDVYRYDLMSNFEMGKFFAPKIGLHIPLFFGYSERFANPLFDPLTQDVYYKDAMRSLTTKAEKDSLRNIAQDYTMRKSFNITNMRLSPEGAKPGILSISNLSVSWSYNEMFQRNVTLERHLRKEYRAALSYGYSISPDYIEPFKKVEFLQSHWFSLIRDFNFNLVPNQFNFTTDFYRLYEELQNRNIAYTQAQLPATFAKDFLWNRNYNLAWDLAKSLKFTYSATNMARIDEPVGMVDRRRDPSGYRHWRDSVWTNLLNFGRNVHFSQNVQLTWQVPFSKLKPIDWISGTGVYQGRFNWDAAPIILENEFGHVYDPGNTIANGRNLNGMLNFSMTNLYNKSKWLKDVNDQFDGKKRKTTATEDVKYESKRMSFKADSRRVITHDLGTTDISVKVTDATGKVLRAQTESQGKNKVAVTLNEEAKEVVVSVTGKIPKKDEPATYATRLMARIAMMIRTINVNYIQDESSILPGFKGESRMFGLSNFNSRLAPGMDFVLGGQATDFLQRARMYDWLTHDSTMISPHIMRRMTTLNIRFVVEPVKDLQITLTGMRKQTTDKTFYNITSNDNNPMQMFGGFEISTIAIGTAFEKSNPGNGYRSEAFETLNRYRSDIAWRHARERKQASGDRYDPGGGRFPDGYNGSSQDVLVPAFIAAYTGKSPSTMSLENFWNIPLPNWNVSYQGFSKADWFKQWFTSGRINHGYTAVYSVNAYNMNPDFFADENGFSWARNKLDNFITEHNMLNVSIRESFNPLFGLDLGWKNDLSTRFSVTKNRALGLSLANNQVTELKNTQYNFELGYFFRKVPLIFKFGENRQKKVDTDLKLTGRFSIGDERSFLRNLDETRQEAQISSGNRIKRLNMSADYTLYKGVTMRLFYDYDFTRPYVAAINTSNTNFGFSLRFSLQQ